MVSVIIPTLLSPKVKDILPRSVVSLIGHPLVHEVIIINNALKPLMRDEHGKIYNSTKVTEIIPGSNLFVNPSWNLGMSVARCDNVVLLNDDVIIVNQALTKIDETLTAHDALIGCTNVMPLGSPMNHACTMDPFTGQSFGFGCCLAMRKSTYKPIPEDLKIWFGDNLLVERFMIAGRHMHKMNATMVQGIVETTSKTFVEKFAPEQSIFDKVKHEYVYG